MRTLRALAAWDDAVTVIDCGSMGAVELAPAGAVATSSDADTVAVMIAARTKGSYR